MYHQTFAARVPIPESLQDEDWSHLFQVVEPATLQNPPTHDQKRYMAYKTLVARQLDQHLSQGGFRLVRGKEGLPDEEHIKPGHRLGHPTGLVLHPLLATIDILVCMSFLGCS